MRGYMLVLGAVHAKCIVDVQGHEENVEDEQKDNNALRRTRLPTNPGSTSLPTNNVCSESHKYCINIVNQVLHELELRNTILID